LTESLLYTSGAIAEQGNVDKGTTRTDTMILERQRGITIQTAVTSFCWNDYKINIVDTPGHMDFLTEAYRSLSVLDGAVLVISAKDGVQAQTRILFHALQKMDIPTIIFINKIDQNGIDLRRVYQSIKDKLTSDMIVPCSIHRASFNAESVLSSLRNRSKAISAICLFEIFISSIYFASFGCAFKSKWYSYWILLSKIIL
jgi:small GTP-binding protein